MATYKYSKYAFFEEVQPNIYLHYSSFRNEFILLNSTKHRLVERIDADGLQKVDNALFHVLLDKGFIVNINTDETDTVTLNRKSHILGEEWYHVVVNTTLDCNLDCWYCYENRIKGSRLTQDTIANICRNISSHYDVSPFSMLKVSFFGGEPFMNWRGIKEIIDYSEHFCEDHSISLLLDFTTNATLITGKMVDYLSKYRCCFQITLDGHEKAHNAIKKSNSQNMNSYRRTLDSLRMLNERVPDLWLAVRINFDNQTLKDIDKIIADISFLDRRKCYIIVKKIWQVDRKDIEKEELLEVIQKLLDNDFLPDYYVMPKGGVCFAERDNQVLFNYDGNIFKCTTICSFDEENTLGKYDSSTGLISWKKEQREEWLSDTQQSECKECVWYGACYGPCNKQLAAHKGEFICTFDAMNLSRKEFLMYLFKYSLLNNKLRSNHS